MTNVGNDFGCVLKGSHGWDKLLLRGASILEFSNEINQGQELYETALEFAFGEKVPMEEPAGMCKSAISNSFKKELEKCFDRRFPKNKRYYQTIFWRIAPETKMETDFKARCISYKSYARFMVIEGLPGSFFLKPKRKGITTGLGGGDDTKGK